jgi:glutamine cyclotransferase
MLRPPATALLGTTLALLSGCDQSAAPGGASTTETSSRRAPAARVPMYTYDVVNAWPHDPAAFTQGLVFLNGRLLESTGLHGESTLRRVDLSTGKVLQQVRLAPAYFGEGMTVLNGKIYQVTWQSQKGFVYNLETFALEKEFTYTGEGWGLTTDGKSLILSDGSHQLRFLDPVTFQVTRTVPVLHDGQPLRMLNELEYIKGEVFANIWRSQSVARIDPATGRVTGIIDFFGLLPAADHGPKTDVLNGIAHDAATDRLFVTGKNWPKLFEVKLKVK